jgi:integration host factor subunit alpha
LGCLRRADVGKAIKQTIALELTFAPSAIKDSESKRKKRVFMADAGSLTRADLSEAIYSEIGLSRAECADLVETILSHMGNALAKGDNVKISGFGSFVLRDKPQRVGRNPMTGVEVAIPPRRVLTFRASPKMTERIAEAS